MEKAIFYVRAMRGEGTGESYEDIIARYQVKMQEKGICEIVDSYADGSPLDDLIESNSLIEIKGMCQEQECNEHAEESPRLKALLNHINSVCYLVKGNCNEKKYRCKSNAK